MSAATIESLFSPTRVASYQDARTMERMADNTLNPLRHTTAHLLAAAVLELYPDAKPTIGPAIERGFYYDFDFGDTKISDDDLPKIEKKMQELLTTWDDMTGEKVSAAEARS